ncbi:putative transmembrane protein [Toxoplasma gondii VAND]|uniref:Putative transmembrane protein n=1 Tax=Toxoplasma gondii VAND TaxID=933077 RepID=A0A086QAY4_TOXGO|nr:putative transmembrane protein [Toxoplasma gondii VAND]
MAASVPRLPPLFLSTALLLCLAADFFAPSTVSPLAASRRSGDSLCLFAAAAETPTRADAGKPVEQRQAENSAKTTVPQTEKGESKEARLLKYAEQRAENAEAELKKFREVHETSVRACTEATQRKQKEVDACQQQAENLRTMYNASQSAKSDVEKKLRELEHKQAAASEATSEKLEREVAALKNGLSQKAQELGEKVKLLGEKEKEAADLAARVRALERDLKHASEKVGEERKSSDHIFTIEEMRGTLLSIGRLYMAIGEHVVACIPREVSEKLGTVKLEVETLAAPYLEVLNAKLLAPVAPTLEKAKLFLETTVYPVAASAAGKGVQMVTSLSDDLLPSVNGRVDAALAPLFASHPDVEALIPPGLGDRLALLLFLVIVTYVLALLAFRTVLCRFFACVCPCCKRRHGKRRHKKFTPAGAAAASAQSSFKDKRGPQETPARPFAFAGDYKKHKA